MKRTAALRLAAITTAGITVWLRIQGAPLVTDISSRGIVDLEMAGNMARWEALTGAWSRTATINNILIDFLFRLMRFFFPLHAGYWLISKHQQLFKQQAKGLQKQYGWLLC
jgi:hypothetical protein